MPRFIGTSKPPTIAQPFNSGAHTADKADSITGIVFSDTAGTLSVDQSIDGTNWDVTDTVAVTANTGAKIGIDLIAPFYRVRYVPTTANPTVFRLGLRPSSHGYRG